MTSGQLRRILGAGASQEVDHERASFLAVAARGGGAGLPARLCRLDARSDVGDRRRRPAVGGRLRRRLGSRPARPPTSPTTPRDDVWQGTFALPAGNYEYKAALNDAWDENYGLHAARAAPTSRSTSPPPTSVKFYYDHKTHWVTDNQNSVIAVAPGSFQSELGCPGDWQPDCLRSWLAGSGRRRHLHLRDHRAPGRQLRGKAAINESWDENYGAGGVPNGANIPFTVPATTRRSRSATTRRRTSSRSRSPTAGRARRALALRPGPQGLPGHGAQHDVEGLVHGRRRRAVRRLLPDDRQHQRRDAAVRRHRRRTFTDLQTRDMTYTVAAARRTGGMACRVTAPRRAASTARHRLRHRPGPGRACVHAGRASRRTRRSLPAVRPVRRDGQRQRRRRRAQRRRRRRRRRHLDRSPVLVSLDTDTATNAANRDYAVPVFAALGRRPFTAASGAASPAPPATGSPSSTPPRADDDVRDATQRQRRADGAGRRSAAAATVTLALGFGTTQADAVGTAERARAARLRQRRSTAYEQGLAGATTTRSSGRADKLPAVQRRRPTARDAYYLSRQRAQGQRGQDVPGRDRGRARQPVGPGGHRRRPGATRTSAPTARSSRATCTRRSPGCSPPATWRPRATRRGSCSTASSSPTARCRATPCSTASSRPTRSATSSTRPRTRS